MAEGLAGRTLLGGEYELREVLGRGGMATVYRAVSRSLEADVAVKVLAPRLAADPGFRERFHDEARSLAGLHHPNLVEVHHYGEEDGLVYIVMRLVPGGTLKDRLQAVHGPLDLVSTARLVSQIADALQLAHDHGLVHLDIKPANVLMGRADWALLADFGITRAIGHQASSGGQQRYAGTAAYMSPEQWRGGAIDGRSDQYSLGITAYELLTGARPFEGQTTDALQRAHLQELPPRPREVNPGIPGPIEDVLLRALAKDPADRYPRIADFAAALGKAVEQTRAVTLETKVAAARIAPNLLGILALLVLGPLLLGLLPPATVAGTGMPLLWPFQFALALMIAALYLGIRWPLIGLLTRGVGAVLEAMDVPVPARRAAGSGPSRHAPSWRKTTTASVEGAVTLVYLFGSYWLLAAPLTAIVGGLFGDPARLWAATALSLAVVVAALLIVVGIFRVAGPAVTAVILGVCWAMAGVLPTADLAFGRGVSVADTVKAVVGAGVLALLLATRPRTQAGVRQLVAAAAKRLLAGGALARSPEDAAKSQRRIEDLVGGVVDFLYLLVGYALLLYPVRTGLTQLVGSVASAIVVTVVVALPWGFLTARLQRIAGIVGVTLGVLLGAPLLVTLPVLQRGIVGSDWPATAATWGVGTLLVLLLAATRGQVQEFGQRALGASLDRRLLGTAVAISEEESARRVTALGAVAGALLDVGYLLIAYWVLGVPAVDLLLRGPEGTLGGTVAGSLLIVALLVAAALLVALPVRRAVVVMRGSRDPGGRSGARVVVAVAIILALLMVTAGAAAPAVLAAPEVLGDLALQSVARPEVIVNWQYLLPWTPSHDQATYALRLSCSNGQEIGRFREAFRPPVPSMPYGPAGTTGPTGVGCENWQRVYFADRQAAGLPTSPSLSWDWLDVKAVLHSDNSADVVETHHLLVTSGSYDHLSWSENGSLQRAEVSDDGVTVPLDPARSVAHYARLWTDGEQQLLGLWFPPVAGPSTRTFTASYHLPDAVQPSGQGGRFEREVLGPARTGPVWRTTVEVSLPGAPASDPITLATSGTTARDGLLDQRTAWFEADDVAATGRFTIVVDFDQPATAPASAVNPSATATPTPTAADTPTPTSPTATATPTPAGAAGTDSTAVTPAADSPTPRSSPTRQPTATPRPTSTRAATATPLPTATPPASPTVAATATTVSSPTTAATATNTPAPPPANNPPAPSAPSPTNTPAPSATPRPSNTPTPSTTPTAVPSPTQTRTATPTRTATATLTETPTATATATATPTVTSTATNTPTPTNTPIGVLTASLSAVEIIPPGFNSQVTWSSTGGISPYTGFITATETYGGGTTLGYATHTVNTPSGSWTDTPPAGCETITYALTLHDGSGQTAGAGYSLSWCSG